MPATPPIPSISPWCIFKFKFLIGIPNGSNGLNDKLLIFKHSLPFLNLLFFGLEKDVPTISSAILEVLIFWGSHFLTTCPLRIIVAFVHKVLISSNLCEIYKIDIPALDSFFRTENKSETSPGVKTEVGSSIIIIFGFKSKHLIISIRCLSPADKLPTILSSEIERPYSFETSRILFFNSFFFRVLSNPNAIFSKTVRASNNEKCWKTIPTPFDLASWGPLGRYSTPFRYILPWSGFTKP